MRSGRKRWSPRMGTPGLDDRIIAFYLQHVVALNIAWDDAKGERQRRVYSCFLLEVGGEWFLVTAGHSLKDLYYSLPKLRGVECNLFDAWHKGASRVPVPFPLLEAQHYLIDDDQTGLDLGLVHVESHFRRMHAKNGIRAFDEKAWRNPPPEKLLPRHALVGFPDQYTQRQVAADGSVHLAVRPSLLYLERVAPPMEMLKPFPCFYGKLPDRLENEHTGETLDDIAGLSGAPILGFMESGEGQLKYFLVAIQSAWRRDLRVLRGPMMSILAEDLDKEMRRADRPPS
jgi:hypothetical protein